MKYEDEVWYAKIPAGIKNLRYEHGWDVCAKSEENGRLVATDVREEDAKLMAAAPELLKAAHKALAEHEDAGCSCRGCAALRAAIKKAEGRP